MSDERESKTWMQTHSGQRFELLAPRAEDVSIEDIAHHLARTLRFSGATSGDSGYSVAQHSVLCADLVEHWGHPAQTQLEALLHDAAEAYTGDFTFPVQLAVRELHKAMMMELLEELGTDARELRAGAFEKVSGCDPLRLLKVRVDAAVRSALGLAVEEPAIVKRADLVALAIERKLLMTGSDRDWHLPERAEVRFTNLVPLPAASAQHAFLRRHRQLVDRVLVEQLVDEQIA